MAKITIPNSETGGWEEKDIPNTMTRREKDDTYLDFFKSYSDRINKIESSLSAKEKDEIKSSNRNIEILAVFVTLFTFISIETQILRSGISFITAVGFSLVILGGLLFFLFSLNFFIEKEKKWLDFGQYIVLLIMSFAILGLGLFFIHEGEKTFYTNLDDKFYKKSEADQQIILNSTKPLDDFKKCILLNGNYWPCLK